MYWRGKASHFLFLSLCADVTSSRQYVQDGSTHNRHNYSNQKYCTKQWHFGSQQHWTLKAKPPQNTIISPPIINQKIKSILFQFVISTKIYDIDKFTRSILLGITLKIVMFAMDTNNDDKFFNLPSCSQKCLYR